MDASEIIGKVIGFLFCGGFVVVFVVIMVAVAKAAKRRQLEMLAEGGKKRKKGPGEEEEEGAPVAQPVEDAYEVTGKSSRTAPIERTSLQNAFIWAEIVGPPVSERGPDDELRCWALAPPENF